MTKLLSELSKDVYIMTGEEGPVFTVEDILEDIESYKEKELFIAIGKECKVDAYAVLDTILEYASQDMNEGWLEDIVDILQRNTSYIQGERVIFDVEEVIINRNIGSGGDVSYV